MRNIRLPSHQEDAQMKSDPGYCRSGPAADADVPVRAASSENRGLAKRSGSMPSIPPAHWTPVVETPTRIGAPFAQQTENIDKTPTFRAPPRQRKQLPSGPAIASRRKDPYSNADMAEEPPSKRKCLGADCNNDAGSLQCPKCLTLGIKDSFFCSQDCFKKNWVSAPSRASGERITC